MKTQYLPEAGSSANSGIAASDKVRPMKKRMMILPVVMEREAILSRAGGEVNRRTVSRDAEALRSGALWGAMPTAWRGHGLSMPTQSGGHGTQTKRKPAPSAKPPRRG